MKPTLHLICNAHLDPVWQWRWEEGASEALSTFRTAVELLHEHEDLIFNHNEAVLYRWVRQYDPVLFGEIQKLVSEGRWCISGGWYLQPDVNLPGAEALIRHIAEGRKFFREFFGATPTVAYNFDSFGHSGGLPQILARAGYKMYIHMRPQPHELALPSDLYRWRGIDGTEIVGLRISVGLYHTERDNIGQRLREGTKLALRLQRDVPVFWGIGDHGGGPTRQDLAVIDDFTRTEDRVTVLHSTPELLYAALAEAAGSAPLVEGDLQRCFTGTYTSISRLKRRCQESLGQLVQTEALRAGSWWLRDQAYPAAELDECWRDHLFNDFHDILPGSCIQPAEQDALDQYGRVAESVRRLRLGAAASFNQGPPRPAYIPLTVLNSDPVLPVVPVEVDCMLDLRPKWKGTWHLDLFDAAGNAVACQEEQPESLLPFNGWRRRVSFLARPGGIGATAYELRIAQGKPAHRGMTPAVRHTFKGRTGLIEALDAGRDRECLAGGLLQPIVVKDEGDSWGTDHWKYGTIVGRFEKESGPEVIETGAIRTVTQTVMTFGKSRIVMNTYAYPEWPVLEVRLRITWNEIGRRLKLAVPTVFRSPQLLCEVPGGAIARPADGQEHVHGRWFMLEGPVNGSDTAFAVAHNGLHGLDFANGEVRLSVLRSAAYCHEQGLPLRDLPEQKYMDQGVHEIRLAVTAGDPDDVRQLLTGLADYLTAPPLTYAHLPLGIPASAGTKEGVATPRQLLSVSPGTVRMLCCKQSNDAHALILRLQETTGNPASARIMMTRPSMTLSLAFKPFEIKTVRIEKSGTWREVHLIDEL